jgi:hypothetical protein
MRPIGVVFLVSAVLSGILACPRVSVGEDVSPTTYELSVNGESFLVELDQQSKLKSETHPNVSYSVALRISPQQRLKLNTIQLEYDRLSQVQDDRGGSQRSVRIRHELGYTVLLTDLGSPLQAGDQAKALVMLKDSVTQSLRESGMALGKEDQPKQITFAGCKGLGGPISYKNGDGDEQACLVYVLTSEKFAATCVVQYFEADSARVKEQIKKLLNSIKGK